jgi:hypothetical protein
MEERPDRPRRLTHRIRRCQHTLQIHADKNLPAQMKNRLLRKIKLPHHWQLEYPFPTTRDVSGDPGKNNTEELLCFIFFGQLSSVSS